MTVLTRLGDAQIGFIQNIGPFGLAIILIVIIIVVLIILNVSRRSTYTSPDSTEQRLEELEGLYDKGLISHEEYEAKRKELLDSL